MAGVVWTASTEGTEVALVAATAKTVLRVTAPANQGLRILGYSVTFDGIDPEAEPVNVQIRKSTTAGTSTAVTLRRRKGPVVTAQAISGKDFTVEPTQGDIHDDFHVHPTSGVDVRDPENHELILGGGERLGIVCTAPAAVNCVAKIIFEA